MIDGSPEPDKAGSDGEVFDGEDVGGTGNVQLGDQNGAQDFGRLRSRRKRIIGGKRRSETDGDVVGRHSCLVKGKGEEKDT